MKNIKIRVFILCFYLVAGGTIAYYSHIIHYVQDEPSKKTKKNNYDISWFPGAERPQQDPTEPSNMRSFQIFMISSSLSATDLGRFWRPGRGPCIGGTSST